MAKVGAHIEYNTRSSNSNSNSKSLGILEEVPISTLTKVVYDGSAMNDGSSSSSNDDSISTNTKGGKMKNIWSMLTEGGTVFDGFLLAASQEVGQVILTLPWVFSLVGMTSGIIFQIFFATTALYTNYLLVNLHSEYRIRLKADKNDPRSNDPSYIVSYHDIMGGLIGTKFKIFSFSVVFLALFGLTTVQVISSGSNMYLISDVLPKREWSLLAGGIFSLVAFIPNFRHYRLLVILANVATTYTSWYTTVAAAVEDPIYDVVYDAPDNMQDYFQGLVGLLFCFGGHASNIEVADVMNDHSTYDKSYLYSFIYVFTLTMPNAITAYYRFGNIARVNQNSFGLYEQTPARDFGIVMMNINNLVAFGLFIGPLFHICEKALKVHDKAFWIRVVTCRLPLCGLIVLVAIAFPFFGPINSVLGSFTTSFATYIIPLVAFNLVFKSDEDLVDMAKPLPKFVNLFLLRYLNYFVAGMFMVFGVGMGGYSSVTNFISQIHQFQFFAKCYMCPED